ncbi:MAG: DUF2332 family protein [Pseudomonadota bacterium]
MTARQIRDVFRRQAAACGTLGSPFTAQLLSLLADRLSENTIVGRAVLGWRGDPVADALALRIAGALHAEVLAKRSKTLIEVYPPASAVDDETLWRAVDHAIEANRTTILCFLGSPPQTNEVARSAALAGGFLTIAAITSLPLALFEIGASAGLNLHWDSYRYDLGGLQIGEADSQPLLAPAWEGPAPPAIDTVVSGRAGCDRAPIDVRSDKDILRLRAYIWPDQIDRELRLMQAVEKARSSPIPIERADAADWAKRHVAELQRDVTVVLFHSIVWQYIAQDSQRRLQHIIEKAGRRADPDHPFAWLRMEPETPKAASLRLTLWPIGETHFLADVDYHGRWIRWHVDSTAINR